MAEIAASVEKPYLSLVVPCYNEELSIPLFYEEAAKIPGAIDAKTEFIFVDDDSKDNTLTILRQLVNQDSRIHYISFSRNFGKEAAMLAGLQAAQGEYVAMLDADLQHPPSLVLQMLEEAANEKKDPLALRNEFDKRFASINESYAKAEYRHSKVISWVWGFPQVLTVFRNLVVSFVVVLMILNDNATIGTLALFISLNHSFFHGVSVLVTTLPGYKDNIDAFTDEVRDIIDGRDLH